MKREIILTAGLFLLSCTFAQAFSLPLDRDGIPAKIVQDVGVSVAYSSGTSVPFLITGGTVSGTKGSTFAIYGILTSTPQGTNNTGAQFALGFVMLRATDTANSSSELLVPPIHIGTWISTADAGDNVGYPANTFIEFNPPLIAQDNLSMQTSSDTAGNTSNTFSFSVFYRVLATNTPEDVWFPIDDYQGEKPLGGSLYGMRPSSNTTAGATANDKLGTEGWDFTNGRKVITTASTTTLALSGPTAPTSPLFFYGFSNSSGSASTFFTCTDTNSTLGTLANNFLPAIYPHTLRTQHFDPDEFTQFNFPWPLKLRNGLACQASVATERFRFYTRNPRALP